MRGALRGQMRVSDTPELELQKIMSCHEGAGSQTCFLFLQEQPMQLTTEPSPEPTGGIFSVPRLQVQQDLLISESPKAPGAEAAYFPDSTWAIHRKQWKSAKPPPQPPLRRRGD